VIECLTPAERTRLQELRLVDPFVGEVLRQLERIVRSATFGRVHRTKSFLVFVVAKTLLGDHEQVKQTTIAMRVFGESAEFDPLESSKVRVAGSALRRRLTSYYANEGKHDNIEVTIPSGTYTPKIRCRETRSSDGIHGANPTTMVEVLIKIVDSANGRIIFSCSLKGRLTNPKSIDSASL
jgi:hypothetical protein